MIVLKEINKTMKNKHIIKDCTFHIRPGECVGLLGKNGAGKTTLLNLMSGMLLPDSGFLRINRTDELLMSKHARKDLVYISGVKSQLWQDLRIKDSFTHCAKMYGTDKSRLDELIQLCEAQTLLDSYPQNLSLGERMRCEIVYALLANSSILFMDEVMIGLDSTVKQRIFECLQQMKNERKTTMIYTSHNLMEVQRLCDRVLLLDEGRVICDGSVERVMWEYAPLYLLPSGKDTVSITIEMYILMIEASAWQCLCGCFFEDTAFLLYIIIECGFAISQTRAHRWSAPPGGKRSTCWCFWRGYRSKWPRRWDPSHSGHPAPLCGRCR